MGRFLVHTNHMSGLILTEGFALYTIVFDDINNESKIVARREKTITTPA